MDVFDLMAKISLDTKDYDSKLEESKSKFGALGSGISKIGGLLTSTVKVAGAALGAASTGVAALSKQSLNEYANYEQLVGGVETLFGTQGMSLQEYANSVGKSVDAVSSQYAKLEEAQSSVLNNAAIAYKSAGMSQNEYMETVTSFSASLIQSLEGDTVKAAEVADRAIKDMSDNANKMGTSIDSIQYAYQGFAKQNYTMLDNLKLGYGGTKEEMQRLITDASKMTDVQSKLGVAVEDGNLSFSNIANAISVVQSKLGIAGTTSKEAAGTIQGSTASMKAAWHNLLTEFAKGDIVPSIDEMTSAVERSGVAWDKYNGAYWKDKGGGIKSLTEQIEFNLQQQRLSVEETAEFISSEYDMSMEDAVAAVQSVQSTIDNFDPKSAGNITSLVNTLSDSVETAAKNIIPRLEIILGGIADLVNQVAPLIAQKIPELVSSTLPKLLNAATELLTSVASQLPSMIQSLLPSVVDGVVRIVKALASQLPTILSVLSDSIPMIIDSLLTLLPELITVGVQVIAQLATGIAKALPKLIPAVVEVILEIVETLIDNIDLLIDASIQLIMGLANGLIAALPILIEKAPEIIKKLVQALLDNAPLLLDVAIELLATIGDALLTNAPQLLDAAIEIVATLIQGVGDTAFKLYEKIEELMDSVGETIEGYFMEAVEWGKGIIRSVVEGIAAMFSDVWDKLEELGEAIFDKFQEIKQTIENIWNAIKLIVSVVMDAISNVITSIWNAITGFLSGALDKIRGFVSNAFEAIRGTIFNVMSAVRNFIANTWDNIKNFISNTVTNIHDKVTSVFDRIESGISEKVGNIKTTIVNGFNAAIDFIKELPGKALQWGKDIIGGIVDGIKAKINSVKEAVSGVADSIKSFLHFSVPDEGPLTDFPKWMPDMMQGLAQGIRSNMQYVESAVSDLAEAMTPEIGIEAPKYTAEAQKLEPNAQTAMGINRVSYAGATININITSNTNDPRGLAERIAEELATLTSDNSSRMGAWAL